MDTINIRIHASAYKGLKALAKKNGHTITQQLARLVAAQKGATVSAPEPVDISAQFVKDVALVLEGFEKAVFTRNTYGDFRSDWSTKITPFFDALARMKAFVDAGKPIEAAKKP